MPQRRRCIAAPTHTGNGWHPRVVPAADDTGIDEKLQLSLTGDRIVDIQAGKFILPRSGGHRQLINKPVIQRFMVLKLKGANRMRNTFNRIFLSMRIVIGGIDNPLITRLVMRDSADAVKRWIP